MLLGTGCGDEALIPSPYKQGVLQRGEAWLKGDLVWFGGGDRTLIALVLLGTQAACPDNGIKLILRASHSKSESRSTLYNKEGPSYLPAPGECILENKYSYRHVKKKKKQQ